MPNAYLGQGDGLRSKVLTASQATTSTSAVTITNLQFPNLPAGTYLVEAVLIHQLSVTGAPSFGVTGGTLTSMSLARKRMVTTATWISGTRVTAYGVSALTGSATATTDFEAMFSGYVTTSAAGTLA